MKGASLTGGGFGQTKPRGGRGSEKESSATGGDPDGRSRATGSKLGRKRPTRQAGFGLERLARWTG